MASRRPSLSLGHMVHEPQSVFLDRVNARHAQELQMTQVTVLGNIDRCQMTGVKEGPRVKV